MTQTVPTSKQEKKMECLFPIFVCLQLFFFGGWGVGGCLCFFLGDEILELEQTTFCGRCPDGMNPTIP